MDSPPDFKTDPKRDATDSIRGYVYQAYQTVLAWMQLKDNEILVLEGSEDFDIHTGSSVVTTQVKDVAANLTLRSNAVIDSLNNYWHCQKRNTGFDIVLRFLATAEAGQEKGSPFGLGQKGLEYWQKAKSDQIEIKPLKTFLLTLGLDAGLASFIEKATDEELRNKLIRRVNWDMGNRPMEALQYNIEDNLKNHGVKLRINSHHSCQVLPHLLKTVADLLSTKGKKELRFGDFLSSFDKATTLSIPRGQMEAMISGSAPEQLSGMFGFIESSRSENIPATIGNPIPIVDGGISRSIVVSNLAQLLNEQRVIFLYGSSGLGKTNLASLLSQEIGGSWGWIGFRNMEPLQIKGILARAAFEMNEGQLSPFLILDDIDLSQVIQFEREFISLVFAIVNKNGMVIITGPTRPPLQLLPKLWKSETCEVTVPYFTETDVEEMVSAHGLTDGKHASAWAKTIWLTTSGHPQLVHARVRNLKTKGWPAIEFSDLTRPEDVERVRAEARNRLVEELPSKDARALTYRLSIINGAFSRETAIAVANTPPLINLPGEVFDVLVGPWVEREEENRYRVSPLLTWAAENTISDIEIKAVHGAIAHSIISRKAMDQFEVGTALFHAFMAKQENILLQLAYHITTTSSDNAHLLYDAMRWFTLVHLDEGQKILSDNPAIDIMLRLAQYKLITFSPEPEKAINLIARIEETLIEIEPPELKQYSEAMAYGVILNTIDVHIPSSIAIRMLSRVIDLTKDNSALKAITSSLEKTPGELPRIGDNKPAQVLFSFQGARLTGLDDLSELVTSLDLLPSNKRSELLEICKSEIDFASLLINRAWWIEIQDGELDVNKAIEVFDFTTMKSREWKVPELTVACLVATSVIQDEYADSAERALKVVDVADIEFPNEASLVNQRAKVLFHEGRDSEALPIAYKALNLPALSVVEFVFCCRAAGIASANSGDWAEAERLFLLGADKAEHSTFENSMKIGFMADAAFALWKQKEYEKSISLFADTLDLLELVTLTENIRVRHLHATVRHSISWIHFDARGEYSTDLVEPLPGMCSNQEPHEGIKDHRIVDISGVWELLEITEQILELDIGVKQRAQVATGGKKPLVVEGYSRTVALESMFKYKVFDDLVPKLINMLEALHHSRTLEDKEVEEWSMGDIPKLPDEYWDKPENSEIIYHLILSASVTCTADNLSTALPIERWRADLMDIDTLPNELDQFLKVLNGKQPNKTIYQQAAAIIFKMRNSVVTPYDLWICSFRLLNALLVNKRWVDKALEDMLIPRWLYSIKNQRFAYTTPSLACPEIAKCCLDQSLSGLSKIATVLDIAAPYLNIPLEASGKQMVKKIIDGA